MKTIAPQFDLPLKAAKPKANPERLLRRKDSKFWQARYIDHTGKLVQRSTGCWLESSAEQWLVCAKAEAARRRGVSTPPPRDFR